MGTPSERLVLTRYARISDGAERDHPSKLEEEMPVPWFPSLTPRRPAEFHRYSPSPFARST